MAELALTGRMTLLTTTYRPTAFLNLLIDVGIPDDSIKIEFHTFGVINKSTLNRKQAAMKYFNRIRAHAICPQQRCGKEIAIFPVTTEGSSRRMKTFKYAVAIVVFLGALAISAKANLSGLGTVPAVPDSGATLMLLGGALAGLGLLGRYLKR